MTTLSKNVCMVKLVDTINKYVNAYHRTITGADTGFQKS